MKVGGNSMGNLIILGAGGHGRVVAEAAELEGKWDRIAFLDDRADITKVLEFDVVGKFDDYESLSNKYEFAFAAIGNNQKRLEWINRLSEAGYRVPIIIHPNANVSKYSSVEEGTIVLAGATVNTNSKVSKGCIININSSVDHDCEIEDGVHICPGAVVRSTAKIGAYSYIGTASCVKSGAYLKQYTYLNEGEVAF